ncbi:hypothetical protein MLD38_030348 [Melastoma candidum]|uniref:Uncharacterized protein n=1 Tax=Melastoma candidum TaxID=119954 RepID=A0ACB9MRL7_9MYRT|nr:hypothetical protein MLD38_030348 [Melastoma candidum]
MALETWLVRVKTAVSHSLDAAKSAPSLHPKSAKKQKVGFLAFEVANLMSRLLRLWWSLSDSNVVRLRNEIMSLEGVRKIVSNDEGFLLGLTCAEMVENLRTAADSVQRLGERCEDPSLLCFGRILEEFADTGRDPNRWIQTGKEVEVSVRRMDRFVALTTNLLREMDELAILENSLRKAVSAKVDERNYSSSPMSSSSMTIKSISPTSTDREQRISDLHQRIVWHKQEIKRFKERSLWNRSFDSVVLLLARSIFTTLARIRVVFGLGHQYPCPSLQPRSPSSSAAIHPTESQETFVAALKTEHLESKGFFKSISRLREPPATTLGANGLSLHYANLIIVMEKMIKSPQLVGPDAREDLYAMLPSSIRSGLRARLKGVVYSASDEALAREWRDALGRILGWLCPLAHNMIKWQSERSFEQNTNRRNGSGDMSEKTKDVFLLQTVYFANKEKTEAAITELLVGLNYVWRFEREMTIKALFECHNIGNLLNVVNKF